MILSSQSITLLFTRGLVHNRRATDIEQPTIAFLLKSLSYLTYKHEHVLSSTLAW